MKQSTIKIFRIMHKEYIMVATTSGLSLGLISTIIFNNPVFILLGLLSGIIAGIVNYSVNKTNNKNKIS